MRNLLKTSSLAAVLLAASLLTASSARSEPTIGASTNNAADVSDGKGVSQPQHAPLAASGKSTRDGEGGWKAGRENGGRPSFGGWLGLAAGLGDLAISSAYMEDATTHYRETCIYVGGCKITIISDPDAPPVKPKIEKRKLAPKPIRHVTDKRSGWTYYLEQDRNGGGLFIQIEDANGSDVHIDGDVPMPGGGPTFPVH